MKNIKFLLKYLRYFLFAKHKNAFGIHSPFLYKYLSATVFNNFHYYATQEILKLRKKHLLSDSLIQTVDFGAGSKVMSTNTRKVSDIVKHSSVKPKYGELLFRTVNLFNPETVLELGTSVGFSTLYLALANTKTKVYTFEGCPETAKFASRNFELAGANNISQIIGNIDKELPLFLENVNKLDFVYFDANHTRQASEKYFLLCLEKISQKSVFIFDDIHWSKGMEQAWETIKSNPKVTLSIDMFFLGIVFFDKNLSKENFIVKF